jgi:hypothetical protein
MTVAEFLVHRGLITDEDDAPRRIRAGDVSLGGIRVDDPATPMIDGVYGVWAEGGRISLAVVHVDGNRNTFQF